MKVKVDQNKCIGCGACAAVCPKVFEMDSKTGKAKAKTSSTTNECAKEAADNCPVGAISAR